MPFIPVLLILALVGISWPAALPWVLAYFIIGGLLGSGFCWAARRHPDKDLDRWAPILLLWNLYAWPIAIFFMFTKGLQR